MQPIQLNLTLEEVNAVITVLGQTPTSSGAYPLLIKIRDQAQQQVNRTNTGPAGTTKEET